MNSVKAEPGFIVTGHRVPKKNRHHQRGLMIIVCQIQ
jgi:hypothetical protein